MATAARFSLGLAALAALPACFDTTPTVVDAGIDASIVDARPIDATPVPPTITSLTPSQGPSTGAVAIVVAGAGFADGAQVMVDGRAATVTAVTADSVTFTLPAVPGRTGAVDVVVTNRDGGQATAPAGFRYFYGTLSFAAKVDHATGAEPRGLALVDLDGDMDLDVATAHRTAGTIAISRNNGNGAFAASVPHVVSGLNTTMTAADWNGDTRIDLATVTVGGGGVTFLFGDGQGGFGAYDPANPLHRRPIADLLRATRGDLDNNGKPDLVLGFRNAGRGVGALLGGAAGFTQTPTTATAADVITVAVGRVDPDGNDDVLAGVAGNLLVLRGNGAGGLAAPVAYPIGSTSPPQQIAIADLDGDGDNDVVVALNGGFGLGLLDNQGNGTFAPVVNLATTGNASRGVAVADLDLDGRRDLVFSNLGGDSVTVRRGLGGGAYAPGVDVAVGDAPQEVFIADVDRDGRLDLVVQNDVSNDFSVLRSTAQ